MYLHDHCPLNPFESNVLSNRTSQFIRATNRLAGFCLSGVLVVNSLMSIYKKTNPLQKYKDNDTFLGSQTT